MADSDSLSIVALVISLIALIVAFGQITQMFLGTAEGYRRCKREVIGAWALQTHRKWHWYEFRLETRFTVPDIDLKSIDQLFNGQLQGLDRMQRLNSKDLSTEIDHTVHLEDSSDSELLVTWIPLIRALHDAYNHYGSDECSQCKYNNLPRPIPWKYTGWVRRRVARMLHKPMLNGKTVQREITDGILIDSLSTRARTEVVLYYRDMSWDFVPTEVVRPMASTHLGPLIVLALRLGMRWNRADWKDNKVRAEGNGYSISPIEVRGLGTVVSFKDDFVGKAARDIPAYIPSEPANKMMCGILPGEPRLLDGDCDFPVIGDNGRPSLDLVYDILRKIGVEDWKLFGEELKREDVDYKMHWFERMFKRPCFNDLTRLIPPFMPLLDSGSDCFTCTDVQYSGLLGMESGSVFGAWESRRVFRFKVEDTSQESLSDTMRYIRDQFRDLEGNFPDDFYIRGSKMALNSRDIPRKRNLLERCSRIHRATTTYFFTGALPEKDPDPASLFNAKKAPVKYADLLAAYSTHALRASTHARQFWDDCKRNQRENKKQGPQLRDYDAEAGPERGRYVVQEWFETGHAYVDKLREVFIPEVKKRVNRYEEGPYGAPLRCPADAEIEEMWWMMVLRGVSWQMSVRFDVTDPAVPANLYDNRTPVWIL